MKSFKLAVVTHSLHWVEDELCPWLTEHFPSVVVLPIYRVYHIDRSKEADAMFATGTCKDSDASQGSFAVYFKPGKNRKQPVLRGMQRWQVRLTKFLKRELAAKAARENS